MFPSTPATPYMQRPPIPGGPPAPHPAGSPAFAAPPLPHYSHTPYAPHQPLVEVHSQPAYPAYYLREPRYGLPPPPSPLPTVPPPDHRDLELAYLRGHVAGLDRRTEGPPPPKEAAQRAPPAPQGPAPDAAGEATPALLLAPARETEPHLRSRHAGPRAQPTGGPAPPDGTYATIAETTAVQAPIEEAARPTAGPTAPQSGTTSAGPRSAPPSAEPPLLEVETVPPTAGITAPVVTRPDQPPGRAGSDEAPTTGAGTAPPARIPLDA